MRNPAKSSCAAMGSVVLLLASFTPTTAYAQAQPFQNIVIIVQENHTPDNLFGSAVQTNKCSGQDDFEPGVDIQDWGYIGTTPTCFTSLPLSTTVNPGHQHGDFKNDDDSGHLDACSGGTTDCYSFIQKSDVLPYFQIATTYGFANYFFQTNEGPSFEAHQFLFGGTSGPVGTNTQGDFHDWFAADNPILSFSNNTGCSSNDPNELGYVNGVKFDGTTATGSSSDPWYVPLPLLRYSYPCYEHNTLADLLGNNGVSWRYYAPEEGSIWSAPTAIYHLCGGLDAGPCPNFQPGGQYANNVVFEGPKGNAYSTAPIFRDIANCNLAQVSWVIPDEKWSDHPDKNDGSGPDYVGSIVNAIGQGMSTSTRSATHIIGTTPPSSSSGMIGAAGTTTSTPRPHPDCGSRKSAQSQAGAAVTPTASGYRCWWSRPGPA